MPTRGTSPGPSVTPSLTATKLRTALRPSLRCVSADQHLQPHHGQARGCFRAVSKKFLKHQKNTQFLHKKNHKIKGTHQRYPGKITESCSGAFEEKNVQKYH